MKTRLVFITLIASLAGFFAHASDITERLQGKDTITYTVAFNGIPSGKIVWRYAGKRHINGKVLDVISVASHTKILKLLNLESDEDIMLDEKTMLPVMVERNVKMFGNQEFIEELYDQKAGIVTITRKDSGKVDQIIRKKPPIHNILALLYFFPQSIALKERETLSFNLPTQAVHLRVRGIKRINVKAHKNMQAYLLSGSGARKFNLWLDVNDKLPLRMDFFVSLGKVVIERQDAPDANKSFGK